MAYITADRVKETTFSIGTGPITLAGAAPTCQPFSAVMAIGDTCAYAIVSVTGSDWETGIGTYTAPNTLTRTTIHASSQSGSAVLFPDGAKDVFLGPTAKSVPGFNPITNTITSGTWAGNMIDVSHGGTGATNASAARSNLGLAIGSDVLAPTGSAAYLTNFPTLNQNTTGTAANVTGVVAISHGGTGLTALGTANQVVMVNANGTGLTYSSPQLSKLADVAVAGLTNGDLLRYDGIAGAWSNTTDVMAQNGDSWNTLLRRMNKLLESLTIVDSQQRQRVVVEAAPNTTVNGTVSVQSTTGNYTSQLQVVGSGSTTTTASTFMVNEGPVDQRWRIVDDARSCYGINIRSRLTFS